MSIGIATTSATAKIMLLITADVPVMTPKLNTDLWSPVPKSFKVPSSLNANFGFAARTVTTIITYKAALYHVREGDIFISCGAQDIKYILGGKKQNIK